MANAFNKESLLGIYVDDIRCMNEEDDRFFEVTMCVDYCGAKKLKDHQARVALVVEMETDNPSYRSIEDAAAKAFLEWAEMVVLDARAGA